MGGEIPCSSGRNRNPGEGTANTGKDCSCDCSPGIPGHIESTLATIRDVLAREYRPQTIFLFGSHAWGIPTDQSDIDICVILKESSQTQADRIRQGLRALLNYHIDLDLLVITEAEFSPRSTHPSTLAYRIAHEGIKLYEAA